LYQDDLSQKLLQPRKPLQTHPVVIPPLLLQPPKKAQKQQENNSLLAQTINGPAEEPVPAP
jgi:hypothetical protein